MRAGRCLSRGEKGCVLATDGVGMALGTGAGDAAAVGGAWGAFGEGGGHGDGGSRMVGMSDGTCVTCHTCSTDPRVACVEGLLSREECAALVQCAEEAGLHPSYVVDRSSTPMAPQSAADAAAGSGGQGGGRGGKDVSVGGGDERKGTAWDEKGRPHATVSGRTSWSCRVPRHHPAVLPVLRRLCELTGLPMSRTEPLQVVRYLPGQEYRPHQDWFDPGGAAYAANVAKGGQRLVSCFVYLADLPKGAGGETWFPSLGLRFTPEAGKALVWYNRSASSDGPMDDRVLHGGLKLERGIKWGLNCWFRERDRGVDERAVEKAAQDLAQQMSRTKLAVKLDVPGAASPARRPPPETPPPPPPMSGDGDGLPRAPALAGTGSVTAFQGAPATR